MIVSTPEVLNGNPRLENTRLSVLDLSIYAEIQNGERKTALPFNTEEIMAAIRFCAFRECDALGEHCGGCSLRTLQDKVLTQQDFINRFQEVRFADTNEVLYGNGEGIVLMPGTAANLEHTWQGINGWQLALSLLQA